LNIQRKSSLKLFSGIVAIACVLTLVGGAAAAPIGAAS
jgi:hypothetical protein